MIRVSYLQIYNEVIQDLLKSNRSGLQIREDKQKGMFVEGLSEWAVCSSADIYGLMKKGETSRVTASTKLNDISSRSHAVFIIVIEQMNVAGSNEGSAIKVGKLNLVDLAGSERLSITGAVGKRLEECKKINQSLSALGNVIAALTDPKLRTHIPYRDSKLTRLLEDSLGGNCKTTMMAMISPVHSSAWESLSSLKFAHRAKNIKNIAKVNEDVDQQALLRRYETELRELRLELEKTNNNVMNKEELYKLEQEKRKAEADKEAAITALEMIFKEVKIEKDARKRLEDKISMMKSQVLLGGEKIEDTPQFLVALEEKHKIIKEEYDKKFHSLEKEREQIEEDKAEVDRYKQLLLKQRDIMIALTERLKERDATIIKLQEELQEYDKCHNKKDKEIETKNMKLQFFENLLKTYRIPMPVFNDKSVSTERKYGTYQQETVSTENSVYLMSGEERVGELMKVVEEQKAIIENLKTSFNKELEKKVEENVNLMKEKMIKSIEAAIIGAKGNDKNEKITQIIDQELLVIISNTLKELKEQKDQKRFQNTIQGLTNLQKMLILISNELK
jgi:kinesin family protein 3/17